MTALPRFQAGDIVGIGGRRPLSQQTSAHVKHVFQQAESKAVARPQNWLALPNPAVHRLPIGVVL